MPTTSINFWPNSTNVAAVATSIGHSLIRLASANCSSPKTLSPLDAVILEILFTQAELFCCHGNRGWSRVNINDIANRLIPCDVTLKHSQTSQTDRQKQSDLLISNVHNIYLAGDNYCLLAMFQLCLVQYYCSYFDLYIMIVVQGYVVCPSEKRFLLLFTFLRKNRNKKVMVFFSSCLEVKYFHELLNYIDIPVTCIHVSSNYLSLFPY